MHTIMRVLVDSRLLILIALWLLHPDYVSPGRHEKRLLNYLFDQSRPDAHNLMERPVKNESHALQLTVKFNLVQVMDVDEKNQVLTTIIWLDMKWVDYHFEWNPADYGNIKNLVLPQSSIWVPDIILYNSADEDFDRIFKSNVIISHNGSVQWAPPGLFRSSCNIDILWFPFDLQNCSLKFGTWTYHGFQIDIHLPCRDDGNQTEGDCIEVDRADLDEYTANGEFDLKSADTRRFSETYSCCDHPFLDLKLFIILQRRALYYVYNLIIPCLIISSMSLMVFMLPPDAGEKISLGVTILLSLTMFLQLVADKLPQTSEAIPLIGIYFCCTMIMCSLSIVFTVLVLNCHHRSTGHTAAAPKWLKLLVNTHLARMLRLTPPHQLLHQNDPFSSEHFATKANNKTHNTKQDIGTGANFCDTVSWNDDSNSLISLDHLIDANNGHLATNNNQFATVSPPPPNGPIKSTEGQGHIRLPQQCFQLRKSIRQMTSVGKASPINYTVATTAKTDPVGFEEEEFRPIAPYPSSQGQWMPTINTERQSQMVNGSAPLPPAYTDCIYRHPSCLTSDTLSNVGLSDLQADRHSAASTIYANHRSSSIPSFDSSSQHPPLKHVRTTPMWWPSSNSSMVANQMVNRYDTNHMSPILSTQKKHSPQHPNLPPQEPSPTSSSSTSINVIQSYRTEMEAILTELQCITAKIRNDELELIGQLEWKFAARVIDRFCFLLFSLLNLIAVVIILILAPFMGAS